MKRVRIAAALLLAVALFAGCAPNGHGGSGTGAETPSIPGGLDPTETTDPTLTAPVTEESTGEPPKPIKLVGRFDERVSDTFTVYMKWTADAREDMTATVTVELRLTCLAIKTSRHAGSITVNGETWEFTTPQIHITTNDKQDLPLAKTTFEIELDKDEPTIELSAEWKFNQTYNGTAIDTVRLSDEVLVIELARDIEAAESGTSTRAREALPTPTVERESE